MTVQPLARWWFAANAFVVAVGLAIQVPVAYHNDEGFFTGWAAALNVFCFFTIHSNIAVGVSSALLATGRASTATWFRALRMIGVIGIALTFVVFHAVLRDLQDLTGQAAVADFLLHTVSPIVCVAGWLLFGPRGLTSRAVIGWMLTYLVLWGAFTLVRGHIVEHDGRHFYPYPFMDPDHEGNGYGGVAVSLALIGLVYVGLALGAHLLDGRLRRARADGPLASSVQPT